jgi:hypothetical protein
VLVGKPPAQDERRQGRIPLHEFARLAQRSRQMSSRLKGAG